MQEESSFGLLSATNYVCKALCLVEDLALCLDLILGRWIRIDLMYSVKLGSVA
jgi:hypothetical protein